MYRKTWVGGNIGLPLITSLDEMMADDLAIVELSSFQLELMSRSPQIGAVLNITPNHLDSHLTMEAYTAAKKRILEFQSREDVAVLGRNDTGPWALASSVKGSLVGFGMAPTSQGYAGTFYRDGSIYLRHTYEDSEPIQIITRSEISLRGEHNLLNVMAACAISSAARSRRDNRIAWPTKLRRCTAPPLRVRDDVPLEALDAGRWDTLVGGAPLLSHRFLVVLHDTGCQAPARAGPRATSPRG